MFGIRDQLARPRPENLVGLVENLIECGFRGSAQSVVNMSFWTIL